jgi:pimeloyl-ACP methyl ester carboxylesterase
MNWLVAIALILPSLAILTRLGALAAEQRHPPAGAFAEIEGVRLHYTDAGSGPPIVLVHGASTSLLDFQASIAGRLSKKHRVIAVDRPGHGYSERPPGVWPDPAQQARLIRLLAHALGVERPIIVGRSWSGSVVLAYLLDYPDEAAGGVLLAGGSHPWEGGVAWYNDVATVPVLGHSATEKPLGTSPRTHHNFCTAVTDRSYLTGRPAVRGTALTAGRPCFPTIFLFPPTRIEETERCRLQPN